MPKHLPWTVMLLCLAGCAAGSDPALPRLDLSAGLKDNDLRPFVGKRVIASGFWESEGKVSGYIHGKERLVGEPIYVKSTTAAGLRKENALYKEMRNGEAAEVTGTLRLYEAPPVPDTPEAKMIQSEATHFYFAVEESEIKPLGR